MIMGTCVSWQGPHFKGKALPMPDEPLDTTALAARRERGARILFLAGLFPMVLGLADPLEGMFIIVVGAAFATVAAFRAKSGARWLLIAGLALFALTLGAMVAVASRSLSLPRFLHPLLIWPWFVAGWLMLAGAVVLARRVLFPGRPRAARLAASGIALGVVLLSVRFLYALSQYQPWEGVAMSARATGEGDGAKLVLLVMDGPFPSDSELWATAVLVNTSSRPLSLPPSTLLDVVVRDEAGAIVWDAAVEHYGKSRPVLPWDGPTLVRPGAETKQRWSLVFPKPGHYQLRAEVRGGPFAGLTTQSFALDAVEPTPENVR
jgi:hypothetical protein